MKHYLLKTNLLCSQLLLEIFAKSLPSARLPLLPNSAAYLSHDERMESVTNSISAFSPLVVQSREDISFIVSSADKD
jgi:hypothetical protein